MIYLDNAATTRVFDSAAAVAQNTMLEDFFNPNATYKSAVKANEKLEQSRKNIAEAVGAFSDEIIFTSCATESNNTVFDCGIKNQKGNIVISAGEHSSVYECAMRLKSRGRDVRIAPLLPSGIVNEQKLLTLVDENTSLVSIIHVSNETGAVNPIKQIVAAIRQKNARALIHCDGVQAVLKLEQKISDLGVDYYSASAHKIGAPKGIGFLYVKRGLNIAPFLMGGGQEHGLRSGTQNTPYIAAFEQAVKDFTAKCDRAKAIQIRHELCDYFISCGYKIVGNAENSGYITCVCIPGVKAEILQNMVHDRGVIIGKGAACSGAKRGNRVLAAMGLSQAEIEGCIRISTFMNTRDEVMSAAQIITETVRKIRSGNVK